MVLCASWPSFETMVPLLVEDVSIDAAGESSARRSARRAKVAGGSKTMDPPAACPWNRALWAPVRPPSFRFFKMICTISLGTRVPCGNHSAHALNHHNLPFGLEGDCVNEQCGTHYKCCPLGLFAHLVGPFRASGAMPPPPSLHVSHVSSFCWNFQTGIS